MTTTGDRWSEIDRIVATALERPVADRSAYVRAACGGQADLLNEVQSLLAEDDCTGPLDAIDLLQRYQDDARRIGPYRLMRELGRGGMGVVYLAQRSDGQYDRDVALKVIPSPFHGDRERDRFLSERQILARLSHPGIAQLFDGGVTDEGLPYFTMEYVHGSRIDAYCDAQQLDIDRRLRLFMTVCDAVAAAHRSLIVHRDLKPTNILVTADGVVKLVDFGIAKALDTNDAGVPTRTGAEIFTPEYASPEQVRGEAVTTSSDVYSLGAVLYHLLTGVGPHQFTSRTPTDVERAICEREPLRPTSAIAALRAGSDADRAGAVSRARRTRLDRLQRRLAGDLDTIVMKALQKDPARRYVSVDRFQHDIGNHLAGLPVEARPDRWAYRARKFVSRHRAAALAGVLVVLSLTAGLVATTIEAARARKERAVAAIERDRARSEAARVKRVSGLLTDLFKLANPGSRQGESVTARELLAAGARRVDTELTGDPETQAALFDTLGQVYRNLALYDPAEQLLQRSLTQRRQLHGRDSAQAAESLHDLAVLHAERGNYAAAADGFREALRLRRQHSADASEIAATLEGLGGTLSEQGKNAEAEPFLREALAIRERAQPDSPQTIGALNALALSLHRKGEFPEAERLFRAAAELGRRLPSAVTPARVGAVLQLALLVHRYDHDPRGAEALYREALALSRALYDGDHPDTATCMSELSRGMRDLGNLEEADTLMRDALAMWKRLYGARHREVMISTQTLAGLTADRGKPAEAERLYREALDMGRELFGEAHLLTIGASRGLAVFLERRGGRGAIDEAQALREREVAVTTRQFGERHAVVARAYAGMGDHWLARNRPADAEPQFRRALDVRQKVHPAGHWRIAEAKAALGGCLLRGKKIDEAEPLLREGYEGLRAAKDAPPEDVQDVRNTLIALYESSGRAVEAARYRR